MRNTPIYLLACLVLSATVGCQSQPGVPDSPFLTADRVPPPGTRNPAPGTAVPYYPATPQPALPAGASVAPLMNNAMANAPPVSQIPVTGVPVALPTDNQPLRMAAPSQPAMIQPVMAAVNLGPNTAAEAVARSPQFSPLPQNTTLAWGSGTPLVAAAPPQPFVAPPASQATYVATPTPRVRLPGYTLPAVDAPASQPVTGQVQVTELPAPVYQPQTSGAAGDGFQPRGTAY